MFALELHLVTSLNQHCDNVYRIASGMSNRNLVNTISDINSEIWLFLTKLMALMCQVFKKFFHLIHKGSRLKCIFTN